MPDKKIFLGKITNALPANILEAGAALKSLPVAHRVTFEQNQSALLDNSNPRSGAWAKMLDLLHHDNRPVYVEIDPKTENITRLCVPMSTKVVAIDTSDKKEVFITFDGSHARHSLHRDNPDFEKFSGLLTYAKSAGTPLMVTATMHEFEIIDVRLLPPAFGKEIAIGPIHPIVPSVAVSPAKAIELFNMVNNHTCTPCHSTSNCIPYKYPYDGCWIRAHLMSFLMIAVGVTPEKVWITGNLTAKSKNVPQCAVHWGWHVAPTLLVTQHIGPAVRMVIDPSLCTGPVTEAVWKSLQGDIHATLTPSTWTGYHYLAAGTATQAQANNDMQYYRIHLDDLCAHYGPPPYNCP